MDHSLTIATSIASWFERERSQSRRRAWSFAKLRVSGRYLSSKQMFSTVVPWICAHTYWSATIQKRPYLSPGLHNCNKKNDMRRDYSLVVLCLCWKQVLCGHSCCPNARCSAGTWWLFVEVRVQPWNKPPTHGKGQRSTWGSCDPDTLVQPGTTAVSGPGLMSGAGRDDDHTAPVVTGWKYSPTYNP